VVSLSVNAGTPSTVASVPPISTNTHDLTIGSREWSTTSGYNMSFTGYIDEVQIWDRPLSRTEVNATYNLTSGSSYLARLDFETLTSSGQLFDFAGGSHPGVISGTTVVEGRTGLARSLRGGSDGVYLSGSPTLSIPSSVTVDVYVDLAAMPSTDASIVARKGSFYLNISSDGLVRWTAYKVASINSSLPIPLGRWVRITASATNSILNLSLDGAVVAFWTGTGTFKGTPNAVTLGYADAPQPQPHLAVALDEFTLLNVAASNWTVADSGPHGIQLNPNATDTDGDGLADGQELYTYTVKTPSRYPIADGSSSATDAVAISLGAPAWAITKAIVMVGVTHPDMGQVSDNLYFRSGTKSLPWFVLKSSGSNAGQSNNFTSYDLFQLGVSRTTLIASQANGYLIAWDGSSDGKKGQIEYVQVQITVHTLPNRAETDRDGLNDSEEVNLGRDGFATNPWNADTDGDGISDGLEAGGWSWSGSTIVSDPAGFKTDPTRADTDRDGVPDGRDRAPLGDAFVRITFQSAIIYGGTDDDTTPSAFEPFASVKVGNQTTYSINKSGTSGSQVFIPLQFVVNVPDNQTYVPITVELWDYDGFQSNGLPDDTHERFAINGSSPTWTLNHPVAAAGLQAYSSSGTGSFRAEQVSLTVETLYASRIFAYLFIPLDYSGVYNVTDATGALASRRYVGEPRFVAVVLNVTKVIPRHTLRYQEVFFLPRSVFFDTLLYKRLASQDTSSPLTNVAFRQNLTSATSNADDLQAILSGNVSGDEESAIILLLKENTTAAIRYQLVYAQSGGAPDTLFMFTLPDGALRLIGYTPFSVDSSVPYRFCSAPNCGVNPTPPTIWEQIWNGIVSTVTGWIVSAIVLAVNAFVQLVAILGQLGSWVADQFAQLPGKIASAVQAAGKVLSQLADFFVREIRSLFEAFAAQLRGLWLSVASGYLSNINEAMTLAVSDYQATGRISSNSAQALRSAYTGGPSGAILATSIGVVAAYIAYVVATVGLGTLLGGLAGIIATTVASQVFGVGLVPFNIGVNFSPGWGIGQAIDAFLQWLVSSGIVHPDAESLLATALGLIFTGGSVYATFYSLSLLDKSASTATAFGLFFGIISLGLSFGITVGGLVGKLVAWVATFVGFLGVLLSVVGIFMAGPVFKIVDTVALILGGVGAYLGVKYATS
jgi:hypothetical protein